MKCERYWTFQAQIAINGLFQFHIYFFDLAGASEIRRVKADGRSCIRINIKGFIAREQQRHCSLYSAIGEHLIVHKQFADTTLVPHRLAQRPHRQKDCPTVKQKSSHFPNRTSLLNLQSRKIFMVATIRTEWPDHWSDHIIIENDYQS